MDNAIKNRWHCSVKKKLDSYLASGLLQQLEALPNPEIGGRRASSSGKPNEAKADADDVGNIDIQELGEIFAGVLEYLEIASCPPSRVADQNEEPSVPSSESDGDKLCVSREQDDVINLPESTTPMNTDPAPGTSETAASTSVDGCSTPTRNSRQVLFQPSPSPCFVACDLIQSESEAYSPFGIRQLMKSSMNCSSPYGTPEAILKSAAKSIGCSSSITKKRLRDPPSPLPEPRSDKKLKKVGACLQTRFDKIGGRTIDTAPFSPSNSKKKTSPTLMEGVDNNSSMDDLFHRSYFNN